MTPLPLLSFEATYRIPRSFSPRFREAIILARDAIAATELAIVLSAGAQLVGIRRVGAGVGGVA